MSDNQRFFNVFEKLKEQGLIGSQVELANVLGTNKAGISDIKSGKKKLSLDNLRSMKKTYPLINLDYLVSDAGEPLLNTNVTNDLNEPINRYLLKTDKTVTDQEIPLYSTLAAAGLGMTFNDGMPNVIDHIHVPNLPKCDGAIYITGDSMYPLLKSGDIVAYKMLKDIKNGIIWGEMYLLSYKLDDDYHTTVKYLQKSDLGDDHVKLVSQNQHHQPKDILLKSVKKLALIKASIRFNSMN